MHSEGDILSTFDEFKSFHPSTLGSTNRLELVHHGKPLSAFYCLDTIYSNIKQKHWRANEDINIAVSVP